MRWLLRLLGISGAALVILLVVILWPDDPASRPDERANLGGDRSGFLPLHQPLVGTVFLAEGQGSADYPYRFCLPALSSPSCLLSVRLQGLAGSLSVNRWYEVTARFDSATPEGVRGVIVEVHTGTPLRLPGPERPRGTRFIEANEVLYNWAAAHGVSGFIRVDGVYVWYLSMEAMKAAEAGGIEPVNALWREP